MRNRIKQYLLILLGIIIFLILPFFLWLLGKEETLTVAILDKTVPQEKYREHHGLIWLLQHYKYAAADGAPYRSTADYYGFIPDEKAESYETRHLPPSLAGTDLIYVADTYGVYEEDLAWSEETASGDAPKLIYGGLEAEEWTIIESQVQDGTDLVMEFNSFASPTSASVREDATDFLGLDWTGWSGRYFEQLEDVEDEASWAVGRFEQNGTEWTYTGGGFVLVNDFDGKIVVLSEEAGDIGTSGIRLAFTQEGEELFSLESSPAFDYWFDISTALEGTVILAEYEWDLQETGLAKLTAQGLPAEFPAVFHRGLAESDIYYFAGDYVDIAEVPAIHRYAGFAAVRDLFALEAIDPDTSFYWSTYAPMMKIILQNAE